MNAPGLRFKEFNEEWKSEVFINVAQLINGRAYKKTEFLERGKYPVLRVGNFFTNDNWYYSSLELDENKYANNGDLLYAWSASFGPKIWTGEKVIYHYHIWKIILEENTNKFFLYNWLIFDANKIVSQQNGSTMVHVTKGSMESRNISIPQYEEQIKIGNFFNSLNSKIQKQQEIVEAWCEYKKGMMQKLFSQELRFKDEEGREFPEWEETQMKNIVSTFSGGTPNSNQSSLYTGDIPFIRSGEISSYTTQLFINDEGLKSSSSKLVEIGDLLYALYGATSGEVAISKISGAINQAVLCIRTKESKQYLLHYLTLMKESILSTYLQGGQGNLSAQIVKEITIPLPSKKEQEKVAGFLSAIDIKVDIEEKKLHCLQEQKNGFMQKMFI